MLVLSLELYFFWREKSLIIFDFLRHRKPLATRISVLLCGKADKIQEKTFCKPISIRAAIDPNRSIAVLFIRKSIFIPASNEQEQCSLVAVLAENLWFSWISWRMPRGSNTPQLCYDARLMPGQPAAGYLTDKWQLMLEIGHHMFRVIDVALKWIIIRFERR